MVRTDVLGQSGVTAADRTADPGAGFLGRPVGALAGRAAGGDGDQDQGVPAGPEAGGEQRVAAYVTAVAGEVTAP